MKIAIYSRKSKVTEKGESIYNQINICKEYIYTHYNNSEIIIYEDEGFSGGNTDRPQYKKLIKDISNKKIDILVCYRLDRISRNVIDFSTTLELLQEKNVGFISIKESFDTTSPIGRAMVYISSVFAQLERETIGERIKDNLEELAKTGRYLGSKAPLGYIKKRIEYIDKNNNTKSYNILEIHKSDSIFIKDTFDKYLTLQSLCKLETYYMKNNIKTKLNNYYTASSIKRILIHPVYACADKNTYNYFLNLGCKMIDPLEKFNEKYGINIYRFTKSIKKTCKINDPKNWLVGVGKHEPILSSTDWIRTQEILESRKSLTIKRPFGKFGVLTGILKCGNCGHYMRPVSLSKSRFYYSCTFKEKSKGKLCNMKNIRGDILDNKIMEDLINYYASNSNNSIILSKNFIINKDINTITINKLKNNIKKNMEEINRLIHKLSTSRNSIVDSYIDEHIKKLHEENNNLSLQIDTINNKEKAAIIKTLNMEILKSKFASFPEQDLDFIAKRNMLKSIISKITYNQNNIEVEL